MTTPQILSLEQRLRDLTGEQFGLDLPNLAALEQKIQHHAARAVIDPSYKPVLQDLIEQKQQGEKAHQRHAEIERELVSTRRDLDAAQAQEQAHRVREANQRMQQARDEYFHAARLIVRAYRRCLTVAQQNQFIPGANTRPPSGFDIMDYRSNPNDRQFSTSDEMKFGVQRYEQEQEAA